MKSKICTWQLQKTSLEGYRGPRLEQIKLGHFSENKGREKTEDTHILHVYKIRKLEFQSRE
jgi:hypothetical protein